MAQSYFYLTDAAGVIWQVAIGPNGEFVKNPVASIPVTPASGNAGGMTRTEILQTVGTLTENKGANLNLERLFIYRLQKFCMEKRFWWRKRTLYFYALAAQETYDLTQIDTFPANTGVQVEEFTRVSFIKSATNIIELNPIFDDSDKISAIESGESGEPCGYFVDPNSNQIVRFDKTPAGVYKIRTTFWALPNPSMDNTTEIVPLVPGYLHHVIVDGLVMDVWRSVYGVQDPKFTTARDEYYEGVKKAMLKQSFDASFSREFRSHEDAVRATS